MSGSAWLDQLQPASWRGLGFGVDSSAYSRGRRTAVHEYPFRDDVWVEDLGRGIRGVSFSGFVVGDDCYAQAQALLDASEVAGPGELVHPSLGSLNVALVGPLQGTERKDLGRVVEIQFEFVQTGIAIYPASSISTQDAASNAADATDAAATGDFLSNVGGALQEGAQVVSAGVATVQGWTRAVESCAADASLITRAVAGLNGNFGRYANGSRSSLLAGVTTVDQAIGAVVAARATVQAGVSSGLALAATL